MFVLPFYPKSARPLRILFISRHDNQKVYHIYFRFIKDKIENNCYGHANGDQEVRMYSHREASVHFLGYQRHCDDKLAYHPCSSHLKRFDDSELGDHIVGSSDEYDNIL